MNEHSNKYCCSGCSQYFEGKPWISISMKRWDECSGPVTFSSYLEYKKHLNKLPKKHFDLIINKEDFNEPRPVIEEKKEADFPFLTETEINDLSYDQYRQYKIDLHDYFLMNPIKLQIYDELINNDAYTRSIEEEYTSEEDDIMDDY